MPFFLLLPVFMLINHLAPAQYQSLNPSTYHTKGTNTAGDTASQKIVKEFLSAIQEKHLERTAALLHPDVTWVQPGENRISGIKKSKIEVLEMFAVVVELSATTLRLSEVKCYDANGNSVACLLRWQAAQPIGKVLNSESVANRHGATWPHTWFCG